MAQYFFLFFLVFFICLLRCLFSKGWHGCICPLSPFWSLSPGNEALCGHMSVCVLGKGSEKKTASCALKPGGS